MTTINLVNAGIGPAKLELFQVSYKNRVAPDLHALLQSCCGLPSDPAERHAMLPEGLRISSSAGQVLRPGQSVTLIELPAESDAQHLGGRFRDASALIRYRACYCSVFDKCWITDLQGLEQQPVNACPVEPSFNDSAR